MKRFLVSIVETALFESRAPAPTGGDPADYQRINCVT
jgi:hypothetical protein